MRALRIVAGIGSMAAVVFALSATTALAAPEFEVELTRDAAPTSTPTTHGDERAVYLVTVNNVASSEASAGDVLTCKNSVGQWARVPAESNFTYRWIRNGVAIPGESGRTYEVAPADEGQGLQCEVTGTNPNTIERVAIGATTTTAGSNVLSAVLTAQGTGTLSSGSATVTAVTTIGDPFKVGQTVSGTGVPPGTTITAVGAGTLALSSNATASGSQALSAGAQPFAVGQTVSVQNSGVDVVPAGTTVTAVNGQSVTMSNNANASGEAFIFADSATPISSSAVAVSQPVLVVEPVPATAPPAPTVDPRKVEARPRIQNAAGSTLVFDGEKRICKAPTNWTPGTTFTFQWLRNGSPIPGATSSEYTPVEGEDKAAVLQCEVFGTTGSGTPPAGGVSVSVSATNSWAVTTQVSPSHQGIRALANEPNNNNVGGIPSLDFSNTTSGQVRLDVELPAGNETYALRIVPTESQVVWNCTKQPPTASQHASATCLRSDSLAPQNSYPPVKIVERPGRDAPDLLVTKATVSGGGADETASAEDTIGPLGPAVPFGFAAFSTKVADEAGNDYTQAGGHPFSAGASLKFTEHVASEVRPITVAGLRAANGSLRVVRTDTPRGFVGNPGAVPARCQTMAEVTTKPSTCPSGSVVGGISLESSEGIFDNEPIYAMESEFGSLPQFAFGVSNLGLAFSLTPKLRADDGYGISLISAPAPKVPELFAATVTLCGFGAQLGTSLKHAPELEVKKCRKDGEAGANPIPFITNPTRCSGPAPVTHIAADTWENPGNFATAEFTAPALTGCDAVDFEPQISLLPTSEQADSPTGLDVEITMPTAGLENPKLIAQANLANSTVTLPIGMSVNPSLAAGLGACTKAEIGLGSTEEAHCPESSKVGSAEVATPLLEEALKGSVYVAKQGDNPFQSLLALYLVFDSKRYGTTIKLAGKVSPDPVTGQLTATFKENPEAPFSRLSLHFASGNRAPLINPPVCGEYGIESKLSPWSAADPANPSSDEIVDTTSSFVITSGPSGSPCPNGVLAPRFSAGITSPVAATTSPFVLNLSREDGSQRFSALDVSLPPGLTGYLKGIPYCSDAVLAGIPTAEGTGAAQLASPSCPAASQLGTASVGAGAGPNPFYANTGRAYLAGPYKGAPLSMAIVTPAVAGPFDLGNVVVRNALYVNPLTAQITVRSDPIPTILHGLLLDVRDIRVRVDRPNFILAPTNCEPMAVKGQVSGEKGGSAAVSSRFQVTGCDRLRFKPNLKIRLHGGTRRGAYQRLVATVAAKPGEANIARAAVTFPHSSFLAQEHIVTICTRVQFSTNQCPAGSIYGRAKATTPLLDYPLEGPVYLRSSSNPLPDLVVALKGPARQPLEVELVGRVDSKNGGIRNTFEMAPDAPVSKFTLEMKGGKKSLIVNSRNLCKGKQRATVRLIGQNGKPRNFRPAVANDCKGKKKKKSGKHKRH